MIAENTIPDLDQWLPDPSLRVVHRRSSHAAPDRLWEAATAITVSETGLLGRLIRWRIPGTTATMPFGELFRAPPFIVLEEHPRALVSGLVGRIWTLGRDYPELSSAAEFSRFSDRGTARVVFGHWVEAPADGGQATLVSDARVRAIDLQGRLGLAAVRPLVGRFGGLVGSEGLAAAVRRAEQSCRAEQSRRAEQS